ncbi:hypothetical protein BUE76_10600 [Cnuella takakiae]|nr:hypothetical protein BUE76_10600 [Cnuella takakiae]
MSDGVGYSTRTRTAYMLAGAGSSFLVGKPFTEPKEKTAAGDIKPWSNWGDNNDLPNKMARDIEECGVLNAALDAKPRIAVGKGLQPFLLLNVDKEGKEDLEWVSDSEIHDFLEWNDCFNFTTDKIFDVCAYGWSVSQLLLSRNRSKINRIRRTDVVTARLGKKKDSGLIEEVHLCADWPSNPGLGSEYVKKIPVLEEGAEGLDIIERTSGYEFAVISRQLRNGRGYYPPPLWYSAKAWVDHAKAIPLMKNAMMRNQMSVKYLVTISMGYWKRIHTKWDTYTPEARKQIMDDKLEEIDKYLTGIEATYKSIFSSSYIDPITKTEIPDIKIEALDDKAKEGKGLVDSAAANSEILFALCVNPALVGAGQPGGAYAGNAGGSNIRESYLTQIMLMERERRQATKELNIVKRFNGWDTRLEVERNIYAATPSGNTATIAPAKLKPRLVFRYPAGVLTTLDTGKSTKGEVV